MNQCVSTASFVIHLTQPSYTLTLSTIWAAMAHRYILSCVRDFCIALFFTVSFSLSCYHTQQMTAHLLIPYDSIHNHDTCVLKTQTTCFFSCRVFVLFIHYFRLLQITYASCEHSQYILN